jgi:large subunit ribosomal protein L30
MTEADMGQIKVTLKRACREEKQQRILDALGLRKLNHSVTHQNTPTIRGMVKKVLHLVQFEELAK